MPDPTPDVPSAAAARVTVGIDLSERATAALVAAGDAMRALGLECNSPADALNWFLEQAARPNGSALAIAVEVSVPVAPAVADAPASLALELTPDDARTLAEVRAGLAGYGVPAPDPAAAVAWLLARIRAAADNARG